LKRRPLKLGLLLLLGAIVNVAVAWGMLLDGSWGTQIPVTNDEFESIRGLFSPPYGNAQDNVDRCVVGVPFHCLEHYVQKGWYDMHVGGFWLDRSSVYLPLRPLWPGFAINTIFYAAILWVLFFAPGAVRRTIRRRRGLCPACAYPIGTSSVCTECGTRLLSEVPRS
jgi:hypothetical protein